MTSGINQNVIVFNGYSCLSSGNLREAATAAKAHADLHPDETLLAFDAWSGRPVELDLRGTLAEVLARLPEPEPEAVAPEAEAEPAPRGPGRPRLGVVPREVTLLPRHWDWLNAQPGGASVALRKLVEDARRTHARRDAIREAQEACYRFIVAVGGNLPQFEAVSRALFAGDAEAFAQHTTTWPEDVRHHAQRMAARAFAPDGVTVSANV